MLKTIATFTLEALIILLAKCSGLLVAVGGGCRAPLNNYCQCLLISLVRLAQLLALGGNHPYFGKQLNELQSPGRLFITQPKM